MKKKILNALVFSALVLGSGAMVGCQDDYDGDIKDLQEQIDALAPAQQATAASLQAEIDQLEVMVNSLPSDTEMHEEAESALKIAQEAAQAAADAALAAANTNAEEKANEARNAAIEAAQAAADAAEQAAIAKAKEDATAIASGAAQEAAQAAEDAAIVKAKELAEAAQKAAEDAAKLADEAAAKLAQEYADTTAGTAEANAIAKAKELADAATKSAEEFAAQAETAALTAAKAYADGLIDDLDKKLTAIISGNKAEVDGKLAELAGEIKKVEQELTDMISTLKATLMTGLESFKADKAIKYSSVKLEEDVVFGPTYTLASGDAIEHLTTYKKDTYMGVGLNSHLYFVPNPAGLDLSNYTFTLERTDGTIVDQITVGTPSPVTTAMTRAESGMYSLDLTCGTDKLNEFETQVISPEDQAYALALVAQDDEGRKIYSDFAYTFESQATTVSVNKLENIEIAFGQTQEIVGASNSDAVYKSYLKAEVALGSPLEAELVEKLGLDSANELDLSKQILERMDVLADGDKFSLELKDKNLVNIPIPFSLHMLGYDGKEVVSNIFTATFINTKYGESTVNYEYTLDAKDVSYWHTSYIDMKPITDAIEQSGYTQADWASEVASLQVVEGENMNFNRFSNVFFTVMEGEDIKENTGLFYSHSSSEPKTFRGYTPNESIYAAASKIVVQTQLAKTDPNKTQSWTVTFRNKYAKPIHVLHLNVTINRPSSSILNDLLHRISALWDENDFDAWVEYNSLTKTASFNLRDVYTVDTDLSHIRFTYMPTDKEDVDAPLLTSLEYQTAQINFPSDLQTLAQVATHKGLNGDEGHFDFTCAYNYYLNTPSLNAWDSESRNIRMKVLSEICADPQVQYTRKTADYNIKYTKDAKRIISNDQIVAKRRGVGELIDLWGENVEPEIASVKVEIIDPENAGNADLIRFSYNDASGITRAPSAHDDAHTVYMTAQDKGISIVPYVTNGQLLYLADDVNLTLRVTIQDVFGFERILEDTFTVIAE